MELNERIEAARLHGDLTRQELADSFTPPVTYESVRAWEAGEIAPRRKKLEHISQITGVRHQWLVAGAGSMLSEGERDGLTRPEVAEVVRQMSHDERMLWLQEIAAAEQQEAP